MIKRLRSMPNAEELAIMYAEPHDARAYGHGHWLRVEHTVALATWMRNDFELLTVADLSCGNAQIVERSHPWRQVYLGDFAPGYGISGPIEETIEQIPQVDLFVLSETLEHVNRPVEVLKQIRAKATYLLLSTPIGETTDDNPEHLWGWDQEGVQLLLDRAGWLRPLARTDLTLPDTTSYQIWSMR